MKTAPLYILDSPTINFRCETKYNTIPTVGSCWCLTRVLYRSSSGRQTRRRSRTATPSLPVRPKGACRRWRVRRGSPVSGLGSRQQVTAAFSASACMLPCSAPTLWRPVEYKDFFFWPTQEAGALLARLGCPCPSGASIYRFKRFHRIASQKDRRVLRARVEAGLGPLS